MVQLILNIIFLLILTTIVILNVGNKTSVNLFFREFQDVSVVVVVFLSFVLGVFYAFCYTVYWKLRKKIHKPAPEKDNKKKKEPKEEVPPPFHDETLPPML